MSQTYLSGFVILLTQLLPLIGVTLGNDQVTAFAQTVVAIGAAVWVMIRRYQQGDITVVGSRKN